MKQNYSIIASRVREELKVKLEQGWDCP